MHGIAEARSFLKGFAMAAGGAAALVLSFVLLLDPYGVSPLRLPLKRAIMDINQRYMYPQLAREGGSTRSSSARPQPTAGPEGA